MSIALEEIERAAMQLDVHERARLAEHLLATLDDEDEIHQAWVKEAEHRAAELDNGSSVAVPLQDAIGQLHARLR